MWRKIFSGRERRRYVRLTTELKVDFKLDDEGSEIPSHKGVTRDISLEGICLTTDAFSKEKWEEIAQKKRHLHLYISIQGEGKKEKVEADAEVQRIGVKANVVWHQNHLLGLHFTQIEKNNQEIIRSLITDNLFAGYRPV
ncbi:MAG: PilZ domain-containing protein [Candidatus Omnitrophica bacterium]|nr:PilZ domain-containing protein [Candidatus Omnitrophota bacterium]